MYGSGFRNMTCNNGNTNGDGSRAARKITDAPMTGDKDVIPGSNPPTSETRKFFDKHGGPHPSNHLAIKDLGGGMPLGNRMQSLRFPSAPSKVNGVAVVAISDLESILTDGSLAAEVRIHRATMRLTFHKSHGVSACPKDQAHYAPATTLFQAGPSVGTGDFTHAQDPTIEPSAQAVHDAVDDLRKQQNVLKSGKSKLTNSRSRRGRNQDRIGRVDAAMAEGRDRMNEVTKALDVYKEELVAYKAAGDAKVGAAIANFEQACDEYSKRADEDKELALLKEIEVEEVYKAVQSNRVETMQRIAEKVALQEETVRVEAESTIAEVKKAEENDSSQQTDDPNSGRVPGTGITTAVKFTEVNREEGTPAANTDDAIDKLLKRHRAVDDVGRDEGKKAKASGGLGC
ncbi:hypothetical protein LTR36_008942 [Oleoguttula mirabilis]|uniref:Uncharacterized protein n=1 Tax=Oleoguttula mirabilis TaxID=1507867 RepID=A0AAV9J7K3_9PEZI|nr:hypothetical protein LTR36_008942 [Oleoguttula mirabilis]